MKRARVLLLLLVSVGLGACAGSASPGSATGSAGSTGSAGTGAPTGAAGSGAACQVDIQAVAPSSFAGLVPGPSAMMRVRGNVTGMVPAYDAWKWSVSLADGSVVPVTTVGRDPSLVEFAMAVPGSYTIAVQLTSSMGCMGLRTVTAAKPGAHVATYRLHVTPPSADFAPEQDLQRQVVGGTPSGGNALPLSAGTVVPLDLRRGAVDGQPVPAYVRFTEVTSHTVVEARTSADGSARVRVAPGRYEMLIVPDDDVAPALLAAQNDSALGGAPISMDDGTLVSGSVTNTDGTPIAGATVVLRAGDLTSTTGKTDAAGAFKVRARAGTFGVTVVSGLAAGGLESKLATAGVVVGGAGPTPSLAIKLHPDPLVTAVVSLSAKNTASVTPETRVTLTAVAPLAGFATIAVGAAAPQPMASDLHFTLHPAANGAVSTGGIPRGRYEMTIFPAKADASVIDGVTTTTLDLTAGNLAPLAMPLAQKVLLKGRLGPQATTPGVQLIALDDTGLPVVAEGSAGPGGLFEIAVSPMRSYALRALPRPYQAFARATFPHVPVKDIDYVVQDRTMPPALLYGGRVVDPSLQGVGTALVQAFCVASAPGCEDPSTPVAETVTRTDGTFELMLPDPDGAP